ncbi:MAG: cation:proton antiporter [Candidatus Paceibacterota bacterium]|nr:MAG: cation:proton antiporter [Candidatus Paceibacterota bacterium]
MPTFFSFFIILLVAVVFSQLFSKMRIPWVVALIVGGMAIGPSGLGLFELDATISFLAQIGLIFLMFMAGLESRFSDTAGIKSKIILIAIFIGLFPALVGIGIGFYSGAEWSASILIGIIFMSSAIALLIPQFQSQKIIGTDLGKTIVNAAIIIDAISLILLSIFLQSINDTLNFWNLIIYPLLLLAFAGFFHIVPKIRWLTFSEDYPEEQDLFEKELRFVILILIGSVVFFELVGLHAIVAGFFAGLILSRAMQSRLLKAKLHAVGYGFFVPVFFVVVGANTNISVFWEKGNYSSLFLATSIILGLLISKFISGFLAGKISKFNNRESVFLGVAVTPQLSTSLAVAFLGFGYGIISQELLSSIVALTITTSIIAPITINILSQRLQKKEVVE